MAENFSKNILRGCGKVKVTTRCIVVPPSPTQHEAEDNPTDYNIDGNNNSNLRSPLSPSTIPNNLFNAQDSCTSESNDIESHNYARNRSTTRSWPVIYRNNSISKQENYLGLSKTEQLQGKNDLKRKSTHQYDFDQIFGLNNANYQQYLAATIRKQSNCDVGCDKSPSLYDMQNPSQENAEQSPSGPLCNAPPTVVFLLLTLFMTTTATAMLCAAIMTDHWENVVWDKEALTKIVNQTDSSKVTNQLELLLEGKAARLPFKGNDRGGVFLVPMHGGIWTLCINLREDEIRELSKKGFPSVNMCFNYLAGNNDNGRSGGGEEPRADWQHSEFQTSIHPHLRMQNLSISCALVCLIILGSAALIGAFGVCQRQISAILVTGVMYLLAALFALFTLMIIHFKRQKGKPMLDSDYDGTVDGLVATRGSARMAQSLLGARIFSTSWSLDLGWGGVALCALASFFWIFLSKLMRFTPLSQLLM
ncbi:CLUMA_CG015192, isoform A [Clunio marinus]|uniref:CLUMA_CG015192, isoform A n=1 Tax=Clunio marinus TaxID=568069 RepID=A0A1J1IV45_9DIPT|nr:CLUMA_CG015192, isoform A [Clunio marinus]